mmetsp:Transcript_34688/g.98292  ORF Transcript_34688/g.98292 Transcript_34688/m.98292 type:complete len:250 (+) Transcript_34688:222-971(+)
MMPRASSMRLSPSPATSRRCPFRISSTRQRTSRSASRGALARRPPTPTTYTCGPPMTSPPSTPSSRSAPTRRAAPWRAALSTWRATRPSWVANCRLRASPMCRRSPTRSWCCPQGSRRATRPSTSTSKVRIPPSLPPSWLLPASADVCSERCPLPTPLPSGSRRSPANRQPSPDPVQPGGRSAAPVHAGAQPAGRGAGPQLAVDGAGVGPPRPGVLRGLQLHGQRGGHRLRQCWGQLPGGQRPCGGAQQ